MLYFCKVKVHQKYMRRCIELAKNGLGSTYPNPLVGCVIVHNETIIGEGWHRKAGEQHAEVLAIASVKDPSLLAESTIYVSLEPCSHFGRTPPCCDLIIAKGIPNVVIGTTDTFSEVSGKGIAKLQDSGKNVTVGVLEEECRELNKRFFTFHEKKRPYLILKWAESLDGYLSPASKDTVAPVWITSAYSRQLVHKWRTEEAAILAGTQTAVDDNPRLDARNWKGNNPVRVVPDRKLRIPESHHVFDGSSKTIIVSAATGTNKNASYAISSFENITDDICRICRENNLQSVIIEGGRQMLQAFIDADLWDEARVFKGNVSFGSGTKAPILDAVLFEQTTIADDLLYYYHNS